MSTLELKRPLAVFDIESTGISPRVDRIIELSVVKLMPDGSRPEHTWRINPERPIPADASAIHGIMDADVADCPKFPQLATEIAGVFDDCDLGGYNLTRFDIPMLCEEFKRAEVAFETESRKVVDVQRIFHRKEPRDLSAALRFFCNETHDGAHGAAADVDATIKVLLAQLERYQDVPHDVASLDDYCNPQNPEWVDRTGRLKWSEGEVVLNFSRKKGMTLKELARDDAGFIKWILRSDFPQDVKTIVENALNGIWPTPPPGMEKKKTVARTEPPLGQIGQMDLL